MQNDIVNFLTNQKNVSCVLEILQHGDQVRMKVIDEFWTGLRDHLLKTRPKHAGGSLAWNRGSEGQREGSAWLDTKPAISLKQRQNIFYRIEYEWWDTGFELYFGLRWGKEIKSSSSLFQIGHAIEIKSLLETRGYEFTDEHAWWGWRYADEGRFGSYDQFLIHFVKQRREMYELIGDYFWPLVQETFPFPIGSCVE